MMFSLWRMALAYKMSSFNDNVARIKFRQEKIDATPQIKKHLANTLTNIPARDLKI